MRVQTIQQKARIILNSDDAVKTLNNTNIIPVRYEPLRFDPTAGTIVNTTLDTINVMDHRFNTGEAVVYSSTGLIGGLTAITYYVINVSPSCFKLAATEMLATAAVPTAIDLTSAGTGTQTFQRNIVFDGSATTVVNIADETITFTNPHLLNSGDNVTYIQGTTAIGGLTTAKQYWVIVISPNIIKLAESFTNAMAGTPVSINLSAVGTGTTHTLRKIITFDTTGSPVIDLVNEEIQLPLHNLKTGDLVLYTVDTLGYAAGTALGGLQDNVYYYVIVVDNNTIKLSDTKVRALANNAINITTLGTGQNHAFMKIVLESTPVCTNYRFSLKNAPFDLNDKCRLVVQSFDYVKTYPTANCISVGGVYCKSIMSNDFYSSQGHNKGSLLLPAYFGNNLSYQNGDSEYNSMSLPQNMTQILQNGFDIFIDSKKRNINNADINRNIDEDSFQLALVIYEIEDHEYLSHNYNKDVKNMPNVRF